MQLGLGEVRSGISTAAIDAVTGIASSIQEELFAFCLNRRKPLLFWHGGNRHKSERADAYQQHYCQGRGKGPLEWIALRIAVQIGI